jgi:uncharacterized SAM-binding protein YcdF (DUF218 family)
MQRQEEILIGGRKRRRFRRWPLLILLLFAFGAVYPHYSATRLPSASGTKSDAIFVLAGGENRIAAGLAALKEDRADQLFILGTAHLALPQTIIRGYAELPEAERRRIHIEGWSETTLENAVSAKGIVNELRLRRLILVTSDYHMPRAYLALRSAIPEPVEIAVLPVRSEWRGGDARWRKVRLFMVESWKYWGYRLLLRWE